jgi:hypothetical protein
MIASTPFTNTAEEYIKIIKNMNFSQAASILLLAALSTAAEAGNVNSQSNIVDITPPRRHATQLSSVKCLNERDTIAVRNSEGGFDRITCAQLRAMGK